MLRTCVEREIIKVLREVHARISRKNRCLRQHLDLAIVVLYAPPPIVAPLDDDRHGRPWACLHWYYVNISLFFRQFLLSLLPPSISFLRSLLPETNDDTSFRLQGHSLVE